MSKVVREKHLNIIELLLQATEVTARLIEEKKLQDCLVLFADCQESAVALGGHIEKLYGMNTKTVAILEQYCECLYQMSVSLDEGVQVEAAYEALQQVTKQIKAVYVEEFPDKKEVVFLPYKAAMWDSLESVWKAADEDPDCDAYVIPIPYHDLDGDGNFKEMHYEGDLYPKYVPITSYEEYDLEERHPDIIFIHNPYDEYNRVTRIEPKFFSSKIKDYTEKLVYIPYFVLGEIDPEDQESIDGISHFCYLPGTMYADKVILQSEDMRQIYINEYLKESKKHGGTVTREELEERFLGLGSPKFDKAVNTKMEDLEIPEEWLRIIEKEDGSWKKIIFYNTSLNAFLENSEQMLEKIEDVLRIFKEYKKEIALLWRPHPLMMQTIESMRPEARERYIEIVRQYREDNWGIYDETSDVNRAVIISDGYYGDGSSLVQVYQATGKPVMIQNIQVAKENNNSLAMDNIVDINGDLYFLTLNDSTLYKYEQKSKKIQNIKKIENNNVKRSLLYGKIYGYKNKIVILPWHANDILFYDTEERKLRNIKLPHIDGINGMKFFCGVIKKQKLFLIPCAYDKIVCVDMEKEKIEFEKSVYGKKFEYIKANKYLAWGSVLEEDENIWFTSLADNKIIQYKIDSNEILFHESSLLKGGGAGICGNNKAVWIIPTKTDEIFCWNKETGQMKKYDNFPKAYESGLISFYKVYMVEDELYLLPRDANMILRINKDGSIQNLNIPTEGEIKKFNDMDLYMRYSYLWSDNDNVRLISSRKGIVYSIKKNTIEIIDSNIRNDEMYDLGLSENNLINEVGGRYSNLTNFILNILKKKAHKDIHLHKKKMMWDCLL